MNSNALSVLCDLAGRVLVDSALEHWKQRSPETFAQEPLHREMRQELARAVERIVEAADTARLAALPSERPVVFFAEIEMQARQVVDRWLEQHTLALAMIERKHSAIH